MGEKFAPNTCGGWWKAQCRAGTLCTKHDTFFRWPPWQQLKNLAARGANATAPNRCPNQSLLHQWIVWAKIMMYLPAKITTPSSTQAYCTMCIMKAQRSNEDLVNLTIQVPPEHLKLFQALEALWKAAGATALPGGPPPTPLERPQPQPA